MNHEQRRKLRKFAKTYIANSRDYLLIYLDKKGNLQYCADLNSITEDESKQNIYEKAIIGMWTDTSNLINGIRSAIRRVEKGIALSDTIAAAKEQRSAELRKSLDTVD